MTTRVLTCVLTLLAISSGAHAQAPGVIREEVSFSVQGEQRRALVTRPTGLVDLPVVMVLHGLGEVAEDARDFYQFDDLPSEQDVVVVYPEGPAFINGDGERQAAWDFDQDLPYFDGLLVELETRFDIDERRVSAIGFSQGAAMSLFLGVQRADALAAVGSVAGLYLQNDQPAQPSRPMPLFMVHNTLDQTVPFAPEVGESPRGTFERWRGWNGCTGPLDRALPGPGVRLDIDESCPSGAETRFYTFTAAPPGFADGHFWPFEEVGGLNYAEEAWSFFRRFALDASSVVADAQVLRVDETAAPGGDGSVSAPFDTLQSALAAATDGDTIKLAPGTYIGPFVLDRSSVAVRGDGAPGSVVLTPVFEANDEIPLFLVTGDNNLLTNLSIRDAAGDGFDIRGDGTTLDLVRTTGCGRNSINIEGADDTLVSASTFSVNRNVDIFLTDAHGVEIRDSAFTNDESFDTRPDGVPIRRTSAISSFTTPLFSTDILMTNLTVTGYSYYGIDLRARDNTVDPSPITPITDVRLLDSTITRCGRSLDNVSAEEPGEEINLGGVLWQGVNDSEVSRNIFADSYGWGMDAYRCDNVLYRNNIFAFNTPEVFPDGSTGPGGSEGDGFGLEVNAGAGNVVLNNLFIGNSVGFFSSYLLEGETDFAAADLLAVNNISIGNTTFDMSFVGGQDPDDLDPDEPFDPRFRFIRNVRTNIIGTREIFGTIENDLDLDNIRLATAAAVRFVDLVGRDYRLAPGSIAIDTGEDFESVPSDLEGDLRPAGVATDLGPYEFQPPSCAADLNLDGTADFFDLLLFLRRFRVSDPSADIAEPFGLLDTLDLVEFLARLDAGCP